MRYGNLKPAAALGRPDPLGVFQMAESTQVKPADSRAQMDNLQNKYDSFVQKRNELNDAARQLRQERDMLHDARKRFKDQMDAAKVKRDELNAKMREAKTRRNELQAQAKELIKSRQSKGGEVSKSLPLQARQLEKQIQEMELRQQTQPHTIEKERELLKQIKAKGQELAEIRTKLDVNREVKVDLNNLDQAIDDLFKQADEAHNEVQAFHKEASKFHDEFVQAVEESRVLTREANEKHKAYIEARERSNEQHAKAMELREQMITIRGERRAEYEAHKRELQDYNKGVQQAVADPKRLEEKAKDDLDALKKGGKISFGM